MHKTLKTFPHGTVRASFGYQNSIEQVETFAHALKKIISHHYNKTPIQRPVYNNTHVESIGALQ